MKNLLLATGLALAILFTLTTLSLAQTQINGCYSNRNGTLRIVANSSQCTKSESFISWNQQGPPGPTGATGPQGPPGVANGVTTMAYGNPNYQSGRLSGPTWNMYFRQQMSTYVLYKILLLNMSSSTAAPPLCVVEETIVLPDYFRQAIAGSTTYNTTYGLWELQVNAMEGFDGTAGPLPVDMGFSFICVQ